MGLDIYFYSATEQENIRTNGEIFKSVDFWEICHLSKRFYPVVDYFRKKYNYDADEHNQKQGFEPCLFGKFYFCYTVSFYFGFLFLLFLL